MRISDWSSDVCSSDLVNAAIFHYVYNDKQIRGIVIDPIFNQLEKLVNIPKSRINGAEVDVTVRPVSGLTLRAAGTYVDSKVLNFVGINNDRVTGDYRGSALPFRSEEPRSELQSLMRI